MNERIEARILGVRTVGVPVSNQGRAVKFYVDTLGFEKRLDVPLPQFGQRWIEVAPPGSATTIALIEAREGKPAGIETGIRFETHDAGAVHARFLEHGVDADELLHWDGVPPMFAFRDPDGNGHEIVGRQP
jgi:lactoylglutathione lyase